MHKRIVMVALVSALATGIHQVPAAARGSVQPRVFAASRFLTRFADLTANPFFAHAQVGFDFYDLDTNRSIVARNESAHCAASTTKLLTEGAALHAHGAGYRFETRIYRTGPIDAGGVGQGQLVVVSSGDPNLSGRARANGQPLWSAGPIIFVVGQASLAQIFYTADRYGRPGR